MFRMREVYFGVDTTIDFFLFSASLFTFSLFFSFSFSQCARKKSHFTNKILITKCIWRISNFAYSIFNANTFNFNLNWCVWMWMYFDFGLVTINNGIVRVPYFTSVCVQWQGCFSSGQYGSLYSFLCVFLYIECFNSLLHVSNLTMKAAPTNYIGNGHRAYSTYKGIEWTKQKGIKDDFYYVSPQIYTCIQSTHKRTNTQKANDTETKCKKIKQTLDMVTCVCIYMCAVRGLL